MTTATLTLAEFLLARIAEDEAMWAPAAPLVRPFPIALSDASGADVASITVDPARVLAECEAKRRIVRNAMLAREACGEAPMSERVASSDGPAAAYWRGQDWVCRVLATAYADHADYREAWRPT